MIRVFLDATVLFSAARDPEGMNRSLLSVAKKRGDVVLLSTWTVMDEADIKFIYMGLRRERVELRNIISKHMTKSELPPVELNQHLAPLTPDPQDAPVIAGAVFAGVDWLVTANVKHFGHLYGKAIRGVLVLPPEEALRRLLPSV